MGSKNELKRRLLTRILKAAVFAFPHLSAKSSLRFGVVLGYLSYFFLPRERKRALQNLALALKNEKSADEMISIARALFCNLGRNLSELLRFPNLREQNIDSIVKIKGREKVDNALNRNKGVIILTAHLGNWELMAAYLSLKGYRGSVVARRIYYEGFDEVISKLRASASVKVIYRTSAREMLKCLHGNGLLGILSDQDTDKVDGVFVDFFGRPAYTPVGPVVLALKTGASIVPCFIVRENGRHTIHVEEPLELLVTGDREKDLYVNTGRCSKVIESYIRKYPSQWVWMHQRWKQKPQNHED